MLYSNFKYGRERLAQDGVTWELIDQVREEDMVVLPCFFQGLPVARFEVGRGWQVKIHYGCTNLCHVSGSHVCTHFVNLKF